MVRCASIISMQGLQSAYVTEDVFLQLPESLERIELIDGEVVVSPSPSFWHKEVLGRIVVALRQWADNQKQPLTVCMAPLDVRFKKNRILQPDAFVLDSQIPANHEGPIDQIPTLCVEVLSQDRVFDRVTKRFLYAEAGVCEYWIVDPAGLVERLFGSGLVQSESVVDTLSGTLLPGFELSIPDLFASVS